MFVFILPVSGGGFVSQLAGLQYLCETNIRPTITLASSGGNVASYIASASDWKWAGIERIASELSYQLFVSQWNSISVVSNIIGYFQGNRYNEGKGINDFLSKYFTINTIMVDEIWTGTYNKEQKRTCLFCNNKTSTIDISHIDNDLTQSTLPIFAHGNINLIAKYGTASASIPSLVPPQKIMGSSYEDGGVSSSSPLTIMSESILQYVEEHNTSMHLIYINSINFSDHNNKSVNNIIDNIKEATSDMIRSSVVNDRLAGFRLLKNFPGTINHKDFTCNYKNIKLIEEIQTKVKYSLLEIYPQTKYEINITNFNGNDIVNKIREAYKDLQCRFWYLYDDNSTNIDYLLDQLI